MNKRQGVTQDDGALSFPVSQQIRNRNLLILLDSD